MPSERAPGWYWVKDHPQYGGRWIVAEWIETGCWHDTCGGWESDNSDGAYAEIGERIPDHE